MSSLRKRASHAMWNVCALLDEEVGVGRTGVSLVSTAPETGETPVPPEKNHGSGPCAGPTGAAGLCTGRGDGEDAAARKGRLAALAEQVRRLSRRGAEPLRCPTGLAALDRALGGGLIRGAIHELIAPAEAAPARTIALLAASRARGTWNGRPRDEEAKGGPSRRGDGWILYFDTALDFYPPAAARLGVLLERLLVVRTGRLADVLWACEQALRCTAVAAVVLPVRSMEPGVSRRLQLAAEAGGGIGLIIRRDETGPTFAATRMKVRAEGVKGSGDRGTGSAGHCFSPILRSPGSLIPFSAQDVRRCLLTVLKLRDGSPPGPLMLELPDAAGDVPDSGEGGDWSGSAPCSAAAG